MNDFGASLWQLPPPFNMIVLIVAIIFGTSLVTAVISETRKFFCHRQELDLKRDLVERGLSVEEVERIVQAQGETTRRDANNLDA